MFAYCDNNPACRTDPNGKLWFALAGGGSLISSLSVGSVGTAVLGALSTITPVGWAVIGTVAVVSLAAVCISHTTTVDNITEERITSPIGRRKNYNSRKKAKEAAKKDGGGKEPINHPKGHHGNKEPHYHPNVKKHYRETPHGVSSHDHYYYPR